MESNIDIKSGKEIDYMLELDERLIIFLKTIKESFSLFCTKDFILKASSRE